MTKLKQQFAAAGIVGVSSDRPERKGWNFKAQKSYQRGRFDNLKPRIGFVFNHKVEQIARAIAFGLEQQATYCQLDNLHNQPPESPIRIGKLKGKGATLFADANTRLAILGLNGAAVLHWLGAMRVVDELSGQRGEVIVNDGTYIYTSVGVLLNLAQDCAKAPEAILNNYKGSQRVRKAK